MTLHHVLSHGLGVDTTLLLPHLLKKGQPLDLVITADTGAESLQTYANLNRVRAFCEKEGVKFAVVSRGEALLDHCKEHRIIPSRQRRWCTEKFKTRPIRKYVSELGWNEWICYMGIDAGEPNRIRQSDKPTITNKFPLFEEGMYRNDCIKLLRKYGWPIPPKSGCFFCPFQSVKAWRNLYLNEPVRFQIAETLEQANKGYPEFIFLSKPLSEIRLNPKKHFGVGNSKMDEYYAPSCDSGYCMV